MGNELSIEVQAKIIKFANNLVLNGRIPEDHGIAGLDEAQRYIKGTSYPENSDYSLFTLELNRLFNLKNKDIVEFCSGPGDLSKEIAKLGAKSVIGIDDSEMMINYSKTKHDLPNLFFNRKNIFDIQDSNKKDLIVCQNSMHHFEDKTLVDLFKSSLDYLKKGGNVYFSDYRRENIDSEILTARLRGTNLSVVDDLMNTIQASYTKSELENILRDLGSNVEWSVYTPEREHDVLRKNPLYNSIVAKDPHPHSLDYRLSQRIHIKKK
jgi:2-polyprenyl-3-methyl-5-hydroxy-6-metoxy-1,4-benzoquinol methylase